VGEEEDFYIDIPKDIGTDRYLPLNFVIGVQHGLVNNLADNAFLKNFLAPLEIKAQDVLSSFAVYKATYIFTLWGGWVFIDIKIVQSYAINWDLTKSTFVFKFFSCQLVLFCTVLYCIVSQQIHWNMAK
jgi:hypothetical protein